MRCPRCAHENTKVLESRLSHEGRSVRRRRSCLSCNYRYTTYEKEEQIALQVKKKDERIESYSRDKVMEAVRAACSKRPISVEDIEALILKVEREIGNDGSRVVDSRMIGDLIMKHLRGLDQVAYVRFASVYKDFKEAEEFVAALQSLMESKTDSNSNSTSLS